MARSTGVGKGNGRHPAGPEHYRFNRERKILSEQGYAKVRVGIEHPLADPNGYAYEHLLVWVSAGRPAPGADEILHHLNHEKTDNRLENLALLTRSEHGLEHHPSALTDAQVLDLRTSYAEKREDMPALAVRFGVPVQRVSKIVRGESRRRAGGPTSKREVRS